MLVSETYVYCLRNYAVLPFIQPLLNIAFYIGKFPAAEE